MRVAVSSSQTRPPSLAYLLGLAWGSEKPLSQNSRRGGKDHMLGVADIKSQSELEMTEIIGDAASSSGKQGNALPF